MLILFKPWRLLADLKESSQFWSDVFNLHDFPNHLKTMINNINIEHKCKDICNIYNATHCSSSISMLDLASLSCFYAEVSNMDLESSLMLDRQLSGYYL